MGRPLYFLSDLNFQYIQVFSHLFPHFLQNRLQTSLELFNLAKDSCFKKEYRDCQGFSLWKHKSFNQVECID